MLTNQQQLELAENPNTNAETLLELASNSKESSVLAAIASNPNSSPDLLVNLAAEYLEEIGQNPALDLILIEVPNFLEKIYEKNFQDRYKPNIAIPNWYLKLATSHGNSELKQFVAQNEFIPISYLERLSEDPCPFVRSEVVINRRTPINILKKFTNERNLIVKKVLAMNRRLPLSVLEDYSEDPDEELRGLVSLHPNLSSFILKKLANDKSKYVRVGLAINPFIPKKLLKKLAKDLDEDVREMVARNESTPRYILKKLSKDPISSVRNEVLDNRNAPIFTVFKFTFAECTYLKWRAEQNLASRFSLILSTLILSIIPIIWYRVFLFPDPFYSLIYLGVVSTLTYLAILFFIWPRYSFIKEIFSRSIEKIVTFLKAFINIL